MSTPADGDFYFLLGGRASCCFLNLYREGDELGVTSFFARLPIYVFLSTHQALPKRDTGVLLFVR